MAVHRERILPRVAGVVSKAKSGISAGITARYVLAERDTLSICRSFRRNLLPQHLQNGISHLAQTDHKSWLSVFFGGAFKYA